MINRIVEKLCKDEVIDAKDITLYNFGLVGLLFTLLNLSTAVVIGIAMCAIEECLIFVLAFAVLRQYAGGYHTRTKPRCYICSSSIIIVVVSLLNSRLEKYGRGLLIVVFLASIIIYVSSPLENENRRLTLSERRNFRRRARGILLAEEIILIFLITVESELCKSIAYAIIVTGMLMAIEIFKRIITCKT